MARILVLRQAEFPWDVRVRREVEALIGAGHQVDVLCLRGPGEPRRERRGPLRILRVPLRHRRGGALVYVLEYGLFAVIAACGAALLHLHRRYDLVQVHSLPDSLVFSAAVPKTLGARVLLDLHELMPEFFATKLQGRGRSGFRMIAAVEQAAIRFADHVITCTPEMRDQFVARGADGAKLDVVLNAADEELFHPRAAAVPSRDGGKRSFTLISHGSIEERYGLDDLVDAVALLRDEIPHLRVRIFGDGSHREAVAARIRRCGLADRVWMSDGWAPLDDLLDALAAADAGVVAMRRDAFRDRTQCNKTFDLVAMERPVVHSVTESTYRAFGPDAFAWYPAGDPQGLAEAIRRLHGNPALQDRLVTRARERVAPMRWPRQREHYLGVVAGVLGR